MLLYRASDFAKAKALYDQATEICKSSTVESNKKAKEPVAPETSKEPVAKKTVDGPLSGTKLLLSNPKDNIQVYHEVLFFDIAQHHFFPLWTRQNQCVRVYPKILTMRKTPRSF